VSKRDLIFLGFAVTLFVALAGHRLAISRQRQDGIDSRRRRFLDFIAQFKAEIVAPRLPDVWVPYFIQIAPELKTRFDQIARDLSNAARVRLSERVDAVLTFAGMNPADIYAQQDKLVAAIESIETFYDTAGKEKAVNKGGSPEWRLLKAVEVKKSSSDCR
jgi:hypothetical protein